MKDKVRPLMPFVAGQPVSIMSPRLVQPRMGFISKINNEDVLVRIEGKTKPMKFSRYTGHSFTKGWWIR